MLQTRLISGPRAGLVMSAVAATLLTLVSVSETLFEPLRVRPGEVAPITLRLPAVAMRREGPDGPELERVSPVIPRGSVVKDPAIAEYVSLYEEARRPLHLGTLVG